MELGRPDAGPEAAAGSRAPLGGGKGRPAFPPLGRVHGPPGRGPVRGPALTPRFATPGLSFCQLQKQQILLSSYVNSTAASYLPQCLDSGDYSPVQCDLRREQCWCVDADGMEVYGTRQRGRPARCKCRERRGTGGGGGPGQPPTPDRSGVRAPRGKAGGPGLQQRRKAF